MIRRQRTFDPRTVPGLELWFDCDYPSITLDKGIRSWIDKSGNGRAASQAATNNQPTLVDSAWGGRPVAEFDGLNDSMSLPLIPLSAWTIFAVCSRVAGTTNGSLIQISPSALGAESALLAINDSSEGPILVGAGSMGSALYGKGGSLNAGQPRVLTAQWAGAATSGAAYYSVRDNGVDVTLSNSSPVQKSGGSDSRIGASWGSGALQGFYRGRVAEILVYNRSLADSERSAVEAYAMLKWGI